MIVSEIFKKEMTNKQLFIGDVPYQHKVKEVDGKLVKFEGEDYYKISNYDAMRPFFMSIVSDSNHWLFISSTGGLTAGRKNANMALFPYYTDDKITESSDITGSKTILHVEIGGKLYLWEPFSNKYLGIYNTTRNLYKNSKGNKIVFEEINDNLGLTYRYHWNSSNAYGFVKKSQLINNTNQAVVINILDGLQNIIPYGIEEDFQAIRSNLADAYKKNELLTETGIGIYSLSAIIVDKAEPSEALKSTIVWSTGIDTPNYLLSSLQLDNFRLGNQLHQEEDIRAEKGAYFINKEITLEANTQKDWLFIANVNQSMVNISEISKAIKSNEDLATQVLNDVELGSKRLMELNAASDGLQLTADKIRNTRHFSNTLFNIMRGGIFDDNYNIEKEDFVKYLANANKEVFKTKIKVLNSLPEKFSLQDLRTIANQDISTSVDKDFKRLAYEYLPLKFSRRHGDPSRPWNKFSINTKSEIDGSKVLDYQGNWRDIFQNWETLAYSYPEFTEGMIHKFLNATTFDGYNPYRVTKDGFDWETIEPHDPWSYIGYWGDHQIIYLLKFLEVIEKHYPNQLAFYFNQDLFVYANVPYKIKPYQEILANPKDTIDFDIAEEEQIISKRKELGADGALLTDKKNSIYRVNFIEKILATVLAKLSNFIPEAGIWMNTQRPEWNDANNALVGNGVSMVTLYYLRRFLGFFDNVLSNSEFIETQISIELFTFFNTVNTTLIDNKNVLSNKVSDADRKTILDGLGKAASYYRETIYNNSFQGHKETISKTELLSFISISKAYLDHSIVANKREDKLYHSYNLMTLKNDSEISISYLPIMLEGQVAVLSSGLISGASSVELLNALRSSDLFRPDQYSYLLYPDKELSRFKDKNVIPKDKAEASVLIQQLIANGNSLLVEKDIEGNYHFNGNFNNAESLREALQDLSVEKYGDLIEKETSYLLDVFEDVFNHKSFTGRSGTFYGYEGLGSIYWHMVSKLLLAVQETCLQAIEDKEDSSVIGRLMDHYYEINEGLGIHKSPELHGAFPTDAYSHTPGGKGAQQPGMTGQVKEDILSRFGELGVFVKEGKIVFQPSLLRQEEFLKSSKAFKHVDFNSKVNTIDLEKDTLAFTYCQVPVIYKLSDKECIKIMLENGKSKTFENLTIDLETSGKIFSRTAEVKQIRVFLKRF